MVLTGGGERAFCTGADMKAAAAPPASHIGDGAAQWFRRHRTVATLDVPVIAGQRSCGGGRAGARLRHRAGSRAGTFLAEARVSRLPLDGGMTLLQRQIPPRAGWGSCSRGRKRATRLALGIVNEAVPRAGLDEAVDRWLEDISVLRAAVSSAIKQVVPRRHLSASRRWPGLPALIGRWSRRIGGGVKAFLENAS